MTVIAIPKIKKITQQRLWFLHWLMASFYLLLFAGGIDMTHLGRDVFYRRPLYDFHKTLGVIVMSLLLARITFLLRVQLNNKRLSQQKKNWMQTFVVHTSLYLFMIFVPLSGYLLSNAGGHDIIIFGTNIALPQLFVKNRQLALLGTSLHFWLSYTFLVFIILHTLQQWRYLRGIWRRLYKMSV
ncbi:MAG: cytochrome b/b6 domain-containing protein [Nostoc sp.]|uniref:cytochrome b n=1 Tax=Nostoc sp. TaxID=1180 RepID=UPI002FF4F1AB